MILRFDLDPRSVICYLDIYVINPWHMRRRVTVVMCVCLSVGLLSSQLLHILFIR